ncbi:hypothetical protein MNBD_GAMMA16-1446 [hydrothermal vent metagenome]|uniref:DUF2393 domain-containing protein n=1 Tax=hydrothermal vent metagenome TaxID=652676 RepID=A0A3B0ZJU8_9ZZZZ
MLWVALLISLILLYLFRKQVSVIVGIVALMAAVVVVYIYNEDKIHERERASITVSVKYDDIACSPDTPLHVVVKNTSQRIAQDVKWNIEVFRFGYSSNVVKGAAGGDPWSTPYRIDTPLKVIEQTIICYSVPVLTGKYEPSQLLYRIANKKVELL